MLRSSQKTLKGARSGGPVPQGTHGREKQGEEEEGPCPGVCGSQCRLTHRLVSPD